MALPLETSQIHDEWTRRAIERIGLQFPITAQNLANNPLHAESAAPGDESTASTTYVDLTTSGPSLTIPVTGLWEIETIFLGYHSAAGGQCIMSYAIGATTAVDADSASASPGVANTDVPMGRRIKRKSLTAGTVLTCKYRTLAGTASFRNASGGLGQPRTIRATLLSP